MYNVPWNMWRTLFLLGAGGGERFFLVGTVERQPGGSGFLYLPAGSGTAELILWRGHGPGKGDPTLPQARAGALMCVASLRILAKLDGQGLPGVSSSSAPRSRQHQPCPSPPRHVLVPPSANATLQPHCTATRDVVLRHPGPLNLPGVEPGAASIMWGMGLNALKRPQAKKVIPPPPTHTEAMSS